MQTKEFSKGDIIIKEGTSGKEIYFILSGSVKVFKTLDGEPVELGTLKIGSFFGEMSLFLGTERSATVQAAEDTVVEVGDKETFLKSIKSDPERAVQVIWTMANRLAEAHKVISELQSQKVAFELILKPFNNDFK